MPVKRIAIRFADPGLPLGLILTVLLCFSLIVCSPDKCYAIGDFALYCMPGCWAEDMPTGWAIQTHLRYVSFEKLFDDHGHAFDPGFKVNCSQLFAKLVHVQRLSDEWQLTNVVIGVLAAHMEMHGFVGGADFDKSVSGTGDVMTTNYIGRWWNNRMMHAGIGFSLKFPLGDYDADRELNICENRYVLYLPFLVFQSRYPLGKGMFFLDYGMNLEWRAENPDTHYNDHDTTEFDAILTYFTSEECKLGFFVQPDFQMAINESTADSVGMHDADFYTFGTALGFIWNMKPGCNINLKWCHEWCGKGLNNGMSAPKIDAIHFMWTYSF